MKKSLKHFVLICATFTLAASALATEHAFIWSSTGGMQDLGLLGGDSFALAINDSGEVAGYFLLADNVTTHAFTWTSATGMVDLGPLPAVPVAGDGDQLRWRRGRRRFRRKWCARPLLLVSERRLCDAARDSR